MRETFTSTTIGLAIREEADRLRDVVILKRVVEDAVPPRLLGRAEVRDLVAEGANLEALRTALDKALDEATDAAAALDAAWNRESERVHAAWPEHWYELAPGSDVLTALWRRARGRYDKVLDGARLAAAMAAPPEEITGVVATLSPDG